MAGGMGALKSGVRLSGRIGDKMEIIQGGVTAAKGFEAAAVAAGIKYKDRNDMALIYSTVPCHGAGAFTTNVVKAAPVIWDRDVLDSSPYVQAVVVNSGIANACTGEQGMSICREEARSAAEVLGIPVNSCLVASTGVIGMQIPRERVIEGIKQLGAARVHSIQAGTEAAKAIMTTDTVHKEVAVTVEIGGKTVTLGGMSKGSGMIHPNMCTMLCFITTDAAMAPSLLRKAVSAGMAGSFNMISVDGDTSTNDTLLVLANGLAGNPEIKEEGGDYEAFCQALNYIMVTLAKMMAGDGEGATCLFEAKVVNAATLEDARILARSVVSSSLTKAAVFGHDANWGRILCALGYSGASFDPGKVDLYFQGVNGSIQICGSGTACDYSEEEAAAILSEPEVTVVADMHMGEAQATAWGCDLSYEYVKINGDYRS